MLVQKQARLEIRSEGDVVTGRQAARAWATELGFRLVDRTRIMTAASELGRNTFRYGGGGTLTLEKIEEGPRAGLRLIFEDLGPGIPDIDEAMRDGFTTGQGMGLGLGGSRRLVDQFEIVSSIGKGTQVTLIKWK